MAITKLRQRLCGICFAISVSATQPQRECEQQLKFNKRTIPTLAYMLCLHAYAFKTSLILSYNLKNSYSPRLGYLFLWRKMIESTVDGFSSVLRSLMVSPTALNTLSLLLVLSKMHSIDLASFGYNGLLIFH